MSVEARDSTRWIGRLIGGRYLARGLLGSGASGTVLAVEDQGAEGRAMALKLGGIEAGDREALIREYRLLGRLSHPNLVPAESLGYHGEERRVYFTMERVEGRPLQELLPGTSLQELAETLAQLARGLAFIHDQGLVHLDVKPDNVRVQPDGVVRLMDLGFAASIGSVAVCRGTPHYAAPEALSAEDPVDARADLYSLGVILYHRLLGEFPFPGQSAAEVLQAKLQGPPPSWPAHLEPELAPLYPLVRRLIAPRPEDRPSGAGDLIRELAEVVGSPLEEETPETRLARIRDAGLVGREKELERVRTVLESAGQRGSVGTLLISGEGGVGLRRMLEEVRKESEVQGFLVVAAEAQREASPFDILASLLRQLVPHTSPGVLARTSTVLARILPELGEASELDPGFKAQDIQTLLSLRVGDVVSDVCRRRHLLVLVDALQRSDTGSLRVLELLARQRASMPLVFATWLNRSESAGRGVEALLQQIRRIPGMIEIELEPMEVAACGDLLNSMFGVEVPRDFVAALHSRTGGNALMIRELLALLSTHGELWEPGKGWKFDVLALQRRMPGSLEEIIPQILADLPAAPAELIRTLSVCTHPVAEEALHRLLDEEAAATAISEALSAGFLRWSSGPGGSPRLGFSSNLAQEAVLASLPEEERAARHRIALDVLQDLPGSDPVEMAWHHLRGAPGPEAFDRALGEARRCRELAAMESAAELYAGALSIDLAPVPPERRGALLEYARVLYNLYRLDGIPALVQEALSLARGTEERAEALRMRALYLSRTDEPEKAEQVLLQVLEDLEPRPHGKSWYEARSGYALLLGRLGRFAEVVPLAKEFLESFPEDEGDKTWRLRVLLRVQGALGNAYWYLGQIQDSLQAHRAALQLARQLNDRVAVTHSMLNMANSLDEQGRFEQAEELWREALEMAQKAGLAQVEAILHNNLGDAAVNRGDIQEAGTRYRKFLEICERIGYHRGIAHGYVALSGMEIRRGKMAEARRLIDLSLAESERTQDDTQRLYALQALVSVDRLSGRYGAARESLRERRRLAEKEGSPLHFGAALTDLARLEQVMGRTEDAVGHARAALARLEECDCSASQRNAALFLAQCLANLDQKEEAREWAEQGEQWLRSERSTPDQMIGWIWYFEALENLGDLNAARELFQEIQGRWPLDILHSHVRVGLKVAEATLEEEPIRARRLLLRALSEAESAGLQPLQIRILADLAERALERGQVSRSRLHLNAALRLVDRIASGLEHEDRAAFLGSARVRGLRELQQKAQQAAVPERAVEVERVERMAELERQSLELHTSLEMEEVLARAAGSLMDLTGGRRVLILLGSARDIVPLSAVEEGGGRIDPERISPDMDLVARAQEAGVALVGDRAAIALFEPNGELLGAFQVEECRDLGREEVVRPLLRSFSDQASTAIQNARIHRRAERTKRQSQELAQVIQELTQCVDVELLLRRITDGAIELVGADRGYLLLQDAAGSLSIRLGRTQDREDLPRENVQISFSTVRRVARDRVGVAYLDAGESAGSSLATDSIRDLELKSILAVPILREEEVLGVLYLDSTRHPGRGFDPEDLALVESLCGAAGVALGTARLLQELREKNKQLEHLDQMKSKFTDLVSHELGTPLAIVSGYLQILVEQLRDRLDVEERESLEGALSAVERLEQATAAVVNLSRLHRERSPIQPRPTRVTELVRSVVDDLRPAAENRNLTLKLHPPNREVVHLLDPVEMAVAIRNLVLNAIRFTPDGGEIHAAIRSRGERLEVAIRDTGIGISQEEHQRIFQRFYEISDTAFHSSGTTGFRSGGLGLGLAVVKTVVEAHGGEILLESRVGHGSIFTISLPR